MGPRTRLLLVAAALGAAFASTSVSAASPASAPCTGSMLAGRFAAVRGSAGAGNIVYRLTLHDSASAPCFLTGVPVLTLLDGKGRKLPTHAAFSGPHGMLASVMVPLSPGAGTSATLTARFSPDVPGPGEPTAGTACERTAFRLRVAPSGGGSALVPISPPTPVCEHGTMGLTVFTAG